jgi:hypothetical protein
MKLRKGTESKPDELFDWNSKEAKLHVSLTLEVYTKLKPKMLERKLTVAWTMCPKCGDRIDATLNGPKKHIHFRCRTPGCLQMME